MSRFRFVEDHRDVYDVKRLCRLAEVSRSGFYAWRTLNRPGFCIRFSESLRGSEDASEEGVHA